MIPVVPAIDLYEIDWGTEVTRTPGDDAVSDTGALELTLALIRALALN